MSSSLVTPSTIATVANGGTVDWSFPGNVVKTTSSYWATATQYSFTVATSYLLYAYGCGFAVPTGATINGIVATLKAYTGGQPSGSNLSGAYIRKASGSFGTTNVSAGITISSTDGSNPDSITLGDSANLWGETWTPADINNSNFGIGVQVSQLSKSFVSLNSLKITVYYTEAASGPAYVKTVNGLAKASVKSVNGLLIASVKTWDGLT